MAFYGKKSNDCGQLVWKVSWQNVSFFSPILYAFTSSARNPACLEMFFSLAPLVKRFKKSMNLALDVF